MPYYMDFHIFDKVTVDEVKQAHVADKSVQSSHGVKYLQFWVNEEMGTVFCLMEGPNAKACAQVHREAHGNVACNITEVKKGFYEQFMGPDPAKDGGLVLSPNGQVDTGQRYLLLVDLVYLTKITSLEDYQELLKPSRPAAIVSNTIREFCGSNIRNDWDDSMLGVFASEENALRGALEIKKLLNPLKKTVSIKMSLSLGHPMSQKYGFFEESLSNAQMLNIVAEEGEIVLDFDLQRDAPHSRRVIADPNVRVLSPSQRDFLNAFFTLARKHLNDPGFSVNFMTAELGVSRPQLYRRIVDITGRSANHFIRDIRLRRALSLLRENRYSVSEIAYEVGFGTPSYFTKRFQEKYGVAPSKIAG